MARINLLVSHSESCHILHEGCPHVPSTDVRPPAAPGAVTASECRDSATVRTRSAMRTVTLATAYLTTAAENWRHCRQKTGRVMQTWQLGRVAEVSLFQCRFYLPAHLCTQPAPHCTLLAGLRVTYPVTKSIRN